MTLKSKNQQVDSLPAASYVENTVENTVEIKALTVEMVAKLNKLYPGHTQVKEVQDKSL